MPNWCHNRVTFTSRNTETIDQLRKVFDSEYPFSSLIPEPDWPNTPNDDGIFPGPRYGRWGVPRFPDGSVDERWYSWRLQNWGVKWDVSIADCTQDYDDLLQYEFDTPWGPPEYIKLHLQAQYPDLDITWFFDEPGMAVAGYL